MGDPVERPKVCRPRPHLAPPQESMRCSTAPRSETDPCSQVAEKRCGVGLLVIGVEFGVELEPRKNWSLKDCFSGFACSARASVWLHHLPRASETKELHARTLQQDLKMVAKCIQASPVNIETLQTSWPATESMLFSIALQFARPCAF